MIYIFGAISALSLVLNLLIYNKVSVQPVITFVQIPAGPVETTEPNEEVQEAEKPRVTVPMVQEVYQGWRNQNGIPWMAPAAPPTPIQPNKPGPLERPDGFV